MCEGSHCTIYTIANAEVERAIRGEVAIGEGDLRTIATGTDLATASATGLIAYLLSLRDFDVTLRGVKQTLQYEMVSCSTR